MVQQVCETEESYLKNFSDGLERKLAEKLVFNQQNDFHVPYFVQKRSVWAQNRAIANDPTAKRFSNNSFDFTLG
jgi:hypothetical protein